MNGKLVLSVLFLDLWQTRLTVYLCPSCDVVCYMYFFSRRKRHHWLTCPLTENPIPTKKKYMFIVLRNVFPGSCSFILSFLQSGIAYFFKGGQGGSNYLNVWLQLLNSTKNIDPIIRQIIFSKFTTLHWIFSFTKSY